MSLTGSLGLEAYDRNYTDRMIPGLNAVPTNYSIRMQHFLRHYLGSANDPVPFGGREEALFALDDWRTDPSAPPYALLVAEAGRGKSALLARWVDLLLASDDVHVIFVPISIRFETSLASVSFIMLAAALGEVYGEPVESKDLSAQQWRDVCKSYLRRAPPSGKPLLVILDGLDEAADFTLGRDFFPSPLPSKVRVLVSARYLVGDVDDQGWRQRLGWESERLAYTLPLPPLTLDGLHDVLREMTLEPQWATDVEVVDELYRLSEGDPLLVRLYVEALFKGEPAALMTVQQLQAMPAGLAGYFERWWAQQKTQSELRGVIHARKEVKDFFNLCAAALGPLTEQDITEIAGEALTSFWQHSAREVERFIMGDGKQQGYTFSHPRLGYYFWEQMNEAEQESWNKRFCDVGRRTLDALSEGTLHPAKASPYAIQYYGAHLERADAPPAAFYALVSQGWMGAWEALEGTHVGFLNDVERAWQRAENERDITMQIKCALCRASVAALSTNIPPELLVLASQNDVLTPTQALVMAKNTQHEYHGSDDALVKLIPLLPLELLPEALAAARQIRDEDRRDCTLSQLARQLPAELLAESLTIIDQIRPECRRCALSHLGNQHPQRLPEVLAVARQIPDDKYRAYTLSALVGQQPELLSEALAIIRQIRDDDSRADGLLQLARQHPSLYAEALTALRQVEDLGRQVGALRFLPKPLPQELIPELLDIIKKIQNEHERFFALNSLAEQAPVEFMPLALDLVRNIQDESERVSGLRSLTGKLPKELIAETVDIVRQIQNECERANALSVLTGQLPEKFLREELAAASLIENEYSRAQILSALAGQLPEELLPEALNLARQIQNESNRASVLSALAGQLPEELLPQALNLARQIQDESNRARVLSALAGQLPEGLLPEALNLARQIQDEWARSRALSGLASQLPKDLLPEALDLARQIQNKGPRASAFSALAKQSPELLPELLAIFQQISDREVDLNTLLPHLSMLPNQLWPKALNLVREMEDGGWRNDFLSTLAPDVPDEFLPQALILVGQTDRQSRGHLLLKFAKDRPSILPELLAIARKIQDQLEHSQVLLALAPHIPDQLLVERLNLVGQIQDEFEASELLLAFASQLSDQLLPEVLAIARHFRYPANVLSALAPQLTHEHLPEALAIARQIRDAESRARALLSLEPYLSGSYLPEVVAAAGEIQDEWSRANVLLALAPQLPDESLPEVLALTRQIRDEGSRADVFLALANQRSQLLPEALAAARQIEKEEQRLPRLLALASHLPDLLSEALATTRQIRDEQQRLDSLLTFAGKLPQELLTGALALVCQIQDERARVNGLEKLVNQLPRELLPEPLTTVRQIVHSWHRANMDSFISERRLCKSLSKVLRIARKIKGDEARTHALSVLIPYLSDEYLPEVLTIVGQIEDQKIRGWALSRLIRRLSDESLPEALMITRQIEDDWVRTNLLSTLIPHLSDEYLPEVLAIAREIEDEGTRGQALFGLATQLPELISEAFAAARYIQDKRSRRGRNRPDSGHFDRQLVKTLKSLAPQLSKPLLLEALGLACQIRNERDRVQVLSALANYLPPELLNEALNTVHQIQDEQLRVNVLSDSLSALVPQLSRWPQVEPDMAYIGWKQMIRALSVRARPAFLKDLSVVIPFMLALAGEDRESVAVGVSQVMQEVSEWWP